MVRFISRRSTLWREQSVVQTILEVFGQAMSAGSDAFVGRMRQTMALRQPETLRFTLLI
jgi:hypothetical protein